MSWGSNMVLLNNPKLKRKGQIRLIMQWIISLTCPYSRNILTESLFHGKVWKANFDLQVYVWGIPLSTPDVWWIVGVNSFHVSLLYVRIRKCNIFLHTGKDSDILDRILRLAGMMLTVIMTITMQNYNLQWHTLPKMRVTTAFILEFEAQDKLSTSFLAIIPFLCWCVCILVLKGKG